MSFFLYQNALVLYWQCCLQTNKRHLSALLFIRLSLDHLNKLVEAPSKEDLTTLSVICTHIWCVVIGITSNIKAFVYKKQID